MGYREPDAPATPNERRGNASMIFRPPEAAQRVTGNVGQATPAALSSVWPLLAGLRRPLAMVLAGPQKGARGRCRSRRAGILSSPL